MKEDNAADILPLDSSQSHKNATDLPVDLTMTPL